MKEMDMFSSDNKASRKNRISMLLEDAEICVFCPLKDCLCDCEHCEESYDKYLKANNKTEEEDLKESGLIQEQEEEKEEGEDLSDLDRLCKFDEGNVLRINVWFANEKVKPIECLNIIRKGTKLEKVSLWGI